MSHLLILTRFNPGHDLGTLRSRAALVKQKTAAAVPELASKCGAKYLLHGSSVSAIDIFNTDDADAVGYAANIIAAHGQAQTEVLPALPWGSYLSAFSALPHQPMQAAAGGGSGAKKYAILTRFHPGLDHATLPQRSTAVKHNIVAAAPELTGKWSDEFILIGGGIDGLDIVESPSLASVAKAANIIRVYGGCDTEVAIVTSWNDFLGKLPSGIA